MTDDFYDLTQIDWTWPREKRVEAVIHELKTVGFFLITNVPDFNEKDLIHYGEWFCNHPEEWKRKFYKRNWNKDNENIYRGLAPFIDNDPSHVEIYDMGLDYDLVSEEEREYSLHERTPWPMETEEERKFTEFMNEHYHLRVRVASELVSIIAEGLGKSPDFFNKWYERDTISTFSINHYCPRSRGLVKNDLIVGD